MPALLCDLDGTLVDSRADLATAVNLLLVELELPPLPLARVVLHVGRGARALVRRSLDDVDPGVRIPRDDPRLRRFLHHYEQVLLDRTVPFPGVVEGLERLRSAGVSLAVVTNKPEAPARAVLDGLGLTDRFGAILGGDTLATRKPAPQMLVRAAQGLGVNLGDCVMLGDSDVDIAAGRAAGIPAWWCSWGGFHPDRPAEADAVVDRFDDVVERMLRR